MSLSEFWLYFLVYIALLVVRFVSHIMSFLKNRNGTISRAVAIIIVLVGLVGGAILDFLAFSSLQDHLPEFVNVPGLIVALSVMIEGCILYGAYRMSLVFEGQQVEPDGITSRYVCDDGHIVKSRGEALIDNWFHHKGIPHKYEDTIILGGEKIKYDWFLPDYDAYIEYWGYTGKKYKERRKEKERLYKQHDKKLVGISNADIEDINTKVVEKLGEFMNNDAFMKPRRCFNCGAELDERYS